MKKRLSDRSQRIGESVTLAIAARAKQMRNAGIDIRLLSIGEPDFPTPDVIKHAAIHAIEQNITRYDHAAGTLELRTVIADKFTRENAMPTTPDEVVVSSGGKHSLSNAMLAILDDDDEVVIPSPYWSSYPDIVRLGDGVPVIVPTTPSDRYKLTAGQFRAAITPRTRMLLLNSPSNPSSVMYTRAELESLGRVAAEHGIYVVSDELYEKIVYDGNEHFSIGAMPELRDLSITVNGVSKAYSMTGWRIGYMRAPKDVAEAVYRIQSQMTSHPSTISQRAALAAMTLAQEDSERMVAEFTRRRGVVVQCLEEIPDITYPRPDGAFYCFVDISHYLGGAVPDSVAMSEYLLTEHRVAVIPGTAFGDANAIRLSYACSQEDIREGIRRLHAGLMACNG